MVPGYPVVTVPAIAEKALGLALMKAVDTHFNRGEESRAGRDVILHARDSFSPESAVERLLQVYLGVPYASR